MGSLRPIFSLSPGVILGDFNAHSYVWGPVYVGGRSEVLEGLMEDYNMAVMNSGIPTRCPPPPTQGRAPDISMCSSSLRHSFVWEVIENTLGSDHLPIKISFGIQPTNAVSICQQNLMRHIDWNRYSDEVRHKLNNFDDMVPPLIKYNRFTDIVVKSAIDAQTRRMGHTSRNFTQTKNWWDNECTAKYREKGRAFREYRRLVTRDLFFVYRRLEGELNRLLAKKKREGWQKFCSGLTRETSLTTLWNMSKKYRGIATRVPIADTSWLNDFANNLAPPFAPPSVRIQVNPTLPDSSQMHGMSSDFTEEELKIALGKCKNTSAGLDLIGFDLIKNLPFDGKEKIANDI